MRRVHSLEVQLETGAARAPLAAGVTLGRDPSCDLVLPSSRISRVHARIEDRGGTLTLVDLGSRNGIHRGEERVLSAILECGVRLRLGPYEVEVVDAPAPEAPTARTRVEIPSGEERYGVGSGALPETEWSLGRGAPMLSRFEVLYRNALVAADATSASEVLVAVLESLYALFGADHVSAHRHDGARLALWEERGEGPPAALGELVARCHSDGTARTVELGSRWVMVAALRSHRSTRGVLSVTSAAAPARNDLELLIGCAHQTALCMDAVALRAQLRAENARLRASVRAPVARIVGGGAAISSLREMIAKVAPTESTVLLQGETGAGKEVVARSIHGQSPRSEGPFVAVNCGALTESLMASELFGHERGSFTGADRRRAGCFERARGGTLFLDEIAELSLDAQVQLLRVLESRRFQRVGGSEELESDVRLVAATHRDLEEAVADERFREDLLFRIDVVPLRIPPLRERLDDLPELCAHLLAELAQRLGKRELTLSGGALEKLREHAWPGNVRELRNVLERASIFAGSAVIEGDDLGVLQRRRHSSAPPELSTLDEMEAAHIRAVLERCGWNKTRAAEVLGIERSTVYKKIRAHGIDVPE